MWHAATTDEFDAWFAELGETAEGSRAREEVRAAITTLQKFGPTLGRPLVDTLNGSGYANMKELRVGADRMVIRVAFAFDPLQSAILLVAGDKGGVSEKRFYRRLIARADSLYAAHLKAIEPAVKVKRDAAKGKKK